MLDRNFIRDSLDHVQERLSRKGFEFDLNGFEKLDKREKSLRIENEELRALRNQTSEQISLAKRKGEDASPQITEMKRVSDRIKELDRLLEKLPGAPMPNLWIPKKDAYIRVDAMPLLGTGKFNLRKAGEIVRRHFDGTG